MSPRPKNNRTVFDPPKFKGYKPHGYYAGSGTPVFLLFEEYTAIRLCDYEGMMQIEAAAAMNISRPTFTRLYESARRKIAEAFSEARPIELERGDAFFDHHWFHCRDCGVFYNTPGKEFASRACPLCRSGNTEAIGEK
ncbi:MAG TPA: DUF134 domain-containing protein [Bacteroidales bacterium]|nr:DUF134 domain-containing protein [Bacteroidales bacterium]